MIVSYQDQLATLANQKGVDLKRAFNWAEVPSSTYYRSMKGERAMTYDVAMKVCLAIHELSDRDAEQAAA